ncbi:gustatory receptor for sugar taste 43a-like [Diabrotica virgifera virgifera]|nr:gustatory receptor for sugar taste 43a-like [Diabrotica virgifera virgifera]
MYDWFSWSKQLKCEDKDIGEYFKSYMSFYILYSMVIIKEVLYWHVIYLLKIKIYLLNLDLEKIRERIYVKGECFLQNIINNVYLENNSGINMEQLTGRSHTASTIVDKSDDSTDLARKLLFLSIYHEKIFEAVAVVNNSMEFCIPLIMLSCLLHLIVTPYFLLAKIISDDTDIYYICLQSIWFMGHVGRVLIIVEPCQSCINEHNKTSSVISDMLTYEVDDTIKKGMTMFSLQFNRWKLRFSSCGFFKISRALLTSIAGAVTTYLVILFQFNTT